MFARSVFHHRGAVRDVPSDGWQNLVDEQGFAAAIFDCDGTIVESADAHMNAMQSAAKDQGLDMAADWYRRRAGFDRQSLFKEFQASVQTAFDVERACHSSKESFASFIHLVKPIAKVVRFATSLRARSIPCAVATNSERSVAELSLSTVGVLDLFDFLVSITDNVKPKPSPEMFELAAERLGKARDQILVIEDSPQGVRAAKDAQLSVIQLIKNESSRL